jgi:hypothetical protein
MTFYRVIDNFCAAMKTIPFGSIFRFGSLRANPEKNNWKGYDLITPDGNIIGFYFKEKTPDELINRGCLEVVNNQDEEEML